MVLLDDARLASDLTRGTRPWTYLGRGWKPINEIVEQFKRTATSWELHMSCEYPDHTIDELHRFSPKRWEQMQNARQSRIEADMKAAAKRVYEDRRLR
jgi:hypothetical protein